MNNSYYTNPILPKMSLDNSNEIITNQKSVNNLEQNVNSSYVISNEMSYIENILRLNRGKKAKFHITIPGSNEFQDKIFEGIIEQSGPDHIIVSNPSNGQWYLILMIYLDFVIFDEYINYIKDFPIGS